MACFLVPTAEAIAATIITKAAQKREQTPVSAKIEASNSKADAMEKIPFTQKLKWLTNMLWGGSFLLAFEHVWHGEVTPWFPFLTAAGDPADATVMLHEMSTVGVTMAVLVTAVWLVMLAVSNSIEKRAAKAANTTATATN